MHLWPCELVSPYPEFSSSLEGVLDGAVPLAKQNLLKASSSGVSCVQFALVAVHLGFSAASGGRAGARAGAVVETLEVGRGTWKHLDGDSSGSGALDNHTDVFPSSNAGCEI